MSKRTFDIEDLSAVIQIRSGKQKPRRDPTDEELEDLTIPIRIESTKDERIDKSIRIVDSLTKEEREVFQFQQGRYLRYRIAVLGIGSAVDQLHAELVARLTDARDLLIEDMNLWAKYQVGLFGGTPRGGVTSGDAEILADQLAIFRPNYLVLVNAGQVKAHFADKTPQQLAIITRHINLGALGGQRPYSVIFVVSKRIPQPNFALYWRTCQAMNTFPAAMQFIPEEVDQLVEYARLEVERYTSNHLVIDV